MLVSAVIADGPPRRVLEAIRDGRCELLLAAPAVDELKRVLRVKLQLEPGSVTAIAALLEELAAAIVDCPTTVAALSGDPHDDRIIAAALVAGAEILVSGDRTHVLPLGQVGDMRIVRPQDLLAEIAD